MHARIATVPVAEGSGPAAAATWERLLPDYRGAAGFRGLLSLHDPASGTAVTVTLWDDEDAADAAAASLRPLAMAAFEGLLEAPPAVQGYDVLLDALSA